MTIKFGIICEGPTDFFTLKHILIGYFEDQSLKVQCLQPSLDETDTTLENHHGNWTHVLRYVESNCFHEAFNFLDYIIIQIDTDICHEAFFNVRTINNNGEYFSEEELYNNVSINIVERIIKNITGADIFENQCHRIIFCVCIHSLECWILAHYDPKQKQRNCEKLLREYIAKSIKKLKYEKKSSVYSVLSKDFLKSKNILSMTKNSKSFAVFIHALSGIT